MKLWLEDIEAEDSQCFKRFISELSAFDKWQKPFLSTLSRLLDRAGLNARSLLSGDKSVVFAILIQNWLHPKNQHRAESIKSGQYKVLTTQEQAVNFVNNLLDQHLLTTLQSIESECKG